MSTETPDRPTPLPDALLSEAEKIADWCEDQRAETLSTAQAQIRVVWMLLLGGLVLLLLLPRVIQYIDFAGREDSLPPVIVESFKSTTETIDSNRSAMIADKNTAQTRVTYVETLLVDEAATADALKSEIRSLVDHPLGVWRSALTMQMPGSYEIGSITPIAGGEIAFTGSYAGQVRQQVQKQVRPPENIGMILLRRGTADWSLIRPAIANADITRVTAAAPGRTQKLVITVTTEDGRAAILGSDDFGQWDTHWMSGDSGQAFLNVLTRMADGSLIAAGSRSTGRETQELLLRSSDGSNWTETVALSGNPTVTGAFTTAITDAGITTLGGYAYDEEEAGEVVSFLTSQDGRTWRREQPRQNDRPVFGIIATIAGDGTGRRVAATLGQGSRIFDSAPNRSAWRPVEKVSHEITALTGNRRTDGEILEFSLAGDRRGARTEIRVLGANPPRAYALEQNGGFLQGDIRAALALPDGSVLAGGSNLLIETLPGEARADLVETLTEGAILPDQIILAAPAGQLATQRGHMTTQVRNLSQVLTRISALETDLRDRKAVFANAEATLARQEQVKSDFGTLSNELKTALRTAEPARQIAQIATRLAVIGLLIYLVQIVVNRYRYLQRLAGYYQARAHAFRLLAAQGDSSLLKGITLADITAMLSPDSIGFDKSAEPPTSEMVSLLQAGLRKT